MSEFWDKRFNQNEFIYGKAPNEFFKSEIQHIQNKGKALFPLEGEGRNACYAAQLGWDVKAFDFSKVGKQKAMKLCQSRNLQIDYSICKAEEFEFKKEHYNLIVLIFAHLNPNFRSIFHQRIAQSLKPGGRVILEGFHPKQLTNNYPSGGPKHQDLLYTLQDVRNDFSILSELKGTELEVDLHEGEHHKGEGFVTRFVGVK